MENLVLRGGAKSQSEGFNFTQTIRSVIVEMIDRLPELSHIDLDRVAIAFAQTRNRSRYGIHATLTPMRFKNGSKTTKKRGTIYKVQRLLNASGHEMLYILTFYLPRFMDVDFNEKLVTILHELWHISPTFNGDIRRHPGRCYAHTHSQKEYDAQMQVFADRWLETDPPANVYRFLESNFDELQSQFGPIYGTKIKTPKLISVSGATA